MSAPLDEEGGMPFARDKVRKQVRKLFVYPFVYCVLWLLPFIIRVLSEEGKTGPFGLRMGGLVTMSIQGMANAAVFCWKEKPWRHKKKDYANRNLRIWHRDLKSPVGRTSNVGRTRDEMVVDGWIARTRRTQEIAQGKPIRAMSYLGSPYWWDRYQRKVTESDKPARQ